MQQDFSTPVQNFKPDYLYWIKHYTGLLWRWKLYIIFIFPSLVIAWLLLVITFGKVRPELNASVLFGLEKQSTVLILPEAFPDGMGKMQLIQSRNFLNGIVDILSLQFVIPKHNRLAIFSQVDIDSSVVPGKYHFGIDIHSRLNYTITVTNKLLDLQKKVITTGRLPSLDTINTAGISLIFSPQFLKKPFDFDFYIIPREKAVKTLRSKLSIQSNTRRNPMMEGVVRVSISGSDPNLISTVINTIADRFVQKNLSFSKRKTTEVMKVLQTQLQTASIQLLQDENQIRVFKEENPKVGLGIDAQNAISNMAILESKDITISSEINDAKDLLMRLTEQNDKDKDQTTSEALLFLSARNITSAIILQKDYSTHLQQKMSLITNRYSAEHPMIKEAQAKIDEIGKKALQLVESFIKKQEDEVVRTKSQKTISLNQLKTLPQKEMQLAALARQQQINSEIYSNLLSRFNQAKIADETEIPDIYIMDYSVPPEETSAKKEMVKLLSIGLLVCVLIGFGPAVMADFFDRRARSEDDLKRFMQFPYLETIPILSKKIEPKGTQLGRTVPMLPIINSNITYINDIFRSLRAKLNYRLEAINGKSLLVTGYEPGVGKTLIAANMAIIASQQYSPTLLIDADLRRGILHDTFSIEKQPGLSDLLLCEHQITGDMLNLSIKQTTFPNLFLLPSGDQDIQNPTELLSSKIFKGMIKFLENRFAMIIIDTPPLSPVTDAVIISNMVSGSVIVVKAGKTNTAWLSKIINEYPAFKNKILGLILNGVNAIPKKRRYSAYYKRNNLGWKPAQQLLLTTMVEEQKEDGVEELTVNE